MTAEQWAAVIAAGAAVVFVAAFVWVAIAIRSTLAEVRKTVVDARTTINAVEPLIAETRATVVSIETVLKTPGVKAAALASGVGRGVQHLKEKLH
jgi:hypothetical protein